MKSSRGEVRPGDTADLSPLDVQAIQVMHSGTSSRKYAQVVTFNEGDPLDEEAREYIPRPPLAEINRLRGRIGFEYNTISEAAGLNSYQMGMVFRGDLTRIGGTYWNLSGYTRGRLNARSTSSQQQTLTDLLNRTYHLTLSYNNPQSAWTAGFGRFYLPWAASLNTIDGGYIGRRMSKGFTIGSFAGTTPDPTSWNYNPDRKMAGVLGNFEGGSFDDLRYSSTFGVALTRIGWKPERQFAFFENGIFYKRYLSIYHNLEVDKLPKALQQGSSAVSPSRSFLTLRVQPYNFLSFDFSHNYFKDNPTFDPRLVGTGLLDKLLFQGFSAGFRLELPLHLGIYSSFGRSSRSGDAQRTLNQMYGITAGRIWKTGIRADARYSHFDTSFGRGSYKALTFSRELGDTLRFETQLGQQDFSSAFTKQNNARFVTGTVDWLVGAHYFLGGGVTGYRGRIQNYNQVFLNLGYRF